MAQYGKTLEHSDIVFQYGGREHVMVRLTDRAWANLERMMEWCEENDVDINTYLIRLFENDDLVMGSFGGES